MHLSPKLIILLCIVILSFLIVKSSTYTNGTTSATSRDSVVAINNNNNNNERATDVEQPQKIDPSSIAVVSMSAGSLSEADQLFRRYTWASALHYCAKHRYSCFEVAAASSLADEETMTMQDGTVRRRHGVNDIRRDLSSDPNPHQLEGHPVDNFPTTTTTTTSSDNSNPKSSSPKRSSADFMCHAIWTLMQQQQQQSSRFTHFLFIGPTAMIMNHSRGIDSLLFRHSSLPYRSLLAGQDFDGSILLVRRTGKPDDDNNVRKFFERCDAVQGALSSSANAAKCKKKDINNNINSIDDYQKRSEGGSMLKNLVDCALTFRVHVQIDSSFSGIAPIRDEVSAELSSVSNNTVELEAAAAQAQRQHRTRLLAAKSQGAAYEKGTFAATFPHCIDSSAAVSSSMSLSPAMQLCLAEMKHMLLESGAAVSPLSDSVQEKKRKLLERQQRAHDQEVKTNRSQRVYSDAHNPHNRAAADDATTSSSSPSSTTSGAPDSSPLPPSALSPSSSSSSAAASLLRATLYPLRTDAADSSSRLPYLRFSSASSSSARPPLRIAILTIAEYASDFHRRSFSEELTYRCTQLSWLNKAQYAQRWGYDFILESGKVLDPMGRQHPAFGKFSGLTKWLPHFDWIWWLDADAMVMNHNLTLEGHMLERAARAKRKEEQRRKDMLEAEKKTISVVGHFDARLGDPSLRRENRNKSSSSNDGNGTAAPLQHLGAATEQSEEFETENFDLLIAKDWNGINTGSMIVRSSKWSIDFFLRAQQITSRSGHCSGIPETWWDQRNMMCMLDPNRTPRARDDSFHIKQYQAQRLFNSYADPTSMSNVASEYHIGDFAVHFPNLKEFPRGLQSFKAMYALSVKLNGGVPLSRAVQLPPPVTFYSASGDSLDAFVASGGATTKKQKRSDQAVGGAGDDQATNLNVADPPAKEIAARGREFAERMKQRSGGTARGKGRMQQRD